MAPSSPGRAPIARLARRTASLVRSAVVVPSLQSILAELVHNSLDANTRSVHCSVDLDTWTIRCDDSGYGIPHSDLQLLARSSTGGDSCRSHLTSKHAPGDDGPASYGFRGEALASIRDLATLDILTRPLAARDDGAQTWHCVLRGERCLAFEQAQVDRTTPGTTVTVRDIFHKLPVRRRSLAKPAAQAALLASLRSTLASLALLHPHVAFSLTSTTTSLSSLSSSSSGPRTLLNVARSIDGLVGRWRQLWGRAGVEKVSTFDEVELVPGGEEGGGRATDGMRARGFFSLSAAHSKAGQHVFVNSRPLAPATSLPHKVLNALLASSSFARFATSHLATPAPGSSSSPKPAAATGKSPRRPAERHPVFVVALEVPGRVVDVSLEPEKSVVEFEDPARVERFLEQLTKRFLTLNGFLHITSTAPPPAPTLVPPRGPCATPPRGEKRTRARAAAAGAVENENEVAPRPAKRLSQRSAASPPVVRPSLSLRAAGDGADAAAEQVQTWLDPRTGELWCVDGRTGNSWRAGRERGEEGCGGCEDRARSGREGKVDRSALRRRKEVDGGEEEEEEVPRWLRESLEAWDNPIFPSAPIASVIPSLPPLPAPAAAGTLLASFRSTKRSALSTATSSKKSRLSARATADAFFRTAHPPAGLELPTLAPLGAPSPLGAGGAPISREQLAAAEFVAQVDTKYLVVRVPASSSSSSSGTSDDAHADDDKATLVLVDQHAASERVRIERLYDAVVGAVARGDRPASTRAQLGLVVSRAEYAALQDRWGRELERWGFEVDLEGGAGASAGAGAGEGEGEGAGGEYRQLTLTAVPSAVALRLLSPREPHLAQELVRAFVAQLDECGPAPAPAPAPAAARSGGAGWVAALRHAPRVLKDLLDSKACRGAVMFNDVLDHAQASKLLAQLSQTLFPGQCAHGRPSMVPVVRFSAGAAAATRAQREEVEWARFG